MWHVPVFIFASLICSTCLADGQSPCTMFAPDDCEFTNGQACGWIIDGSLRYDQNGTSWYLFLDKLENTAGNLTSRTACSTGGSAHCFQLHYLFEHDNHSALSVLVQEGGGETREVWTITYNMNSGTWESFQIPIVTNANFIVIIEMKDKIGSDSKIYVDSIQYTSSPCSNQPPEAIPPLKITPSPSAPLPPSQAVPTVPNSLQPQLDSTETHPMYLTQTGQTAPESTHSPPPENFLDESEKPSKEIFVIEGIAAAVLVIAGITTTAVVLVFRRKRKNKKKQERFPAAMSDDTNPDAAEHLDASNSDINHSSYVNRASSSSEYENHRLGIPTAQSQNVTLSAAKNSPDIEAGASITSMPEYSAMNKTKKARKVELRTRSEHSTEKHCQICEASQNPSGSGTLRSEEIKRPDESDSSENYYNVCELPSLASASPSLPEECTGTGEYTDLDFSNSEQECREYTSLYEEQATSGNNDTREQDKQRCEQKGTNEYSSLDVTNAEQERSIYTPLQE